MKSTVMCILSFLLFFSCIDLSAINLLKGCNLNSQSCAFSDIVKVQYDVLQKTKIVVSNMCSNILKDVCFLLSAKQIKMVFFDIHKIEQNLSVCVLFNYIKQLLFTKLFLDKFYTNNVVVPILFFKFIFLFMLSYLGLLFAFSKGKNFQQHYINAYSI